VWQFFAIYCKSLFDIYSSVFHFNHIAINLFKLIMVVIFYFFFKRDNIFLKYIVVLFKIFDIVQFEALWPFIFFEFISQITNNNPATSGRKVPDAIFQADRKEFLLLKQKTIKNKQNKINQKKNRHNN
ncbi:hypothetical protein RFI_02545, partial [Reticulomyxa filosa]